MQVSDAQPVASKVVVGKDGVRSVGDEPADRAGSRARPGFRGMLGRRRSASTDGMNDVASGAAMAMWFRLESVPGATSAAAQARADGVAGARAVDRLLIGSGPDGVQARIRIGGGALAGTEIQLTAVGAGRTVEARLLTHAASSRQTLSVVLDEIRARLRDRGVVLATSAPVARSAAQTRSDGPSGEYR